MDTYFPPSENSGGWRKKTDPAFVHSLGLDADRLEAFGQYNLSLEESSGHASCIVIKNGWIVGEWYSKPETETFCQYISSNGKSYSIVLFGMIVEDSKNGLLPYPIDVDSHVYDQRWLPEGFPLSDPRKAQITFEQIFSHTSGILPESAQGPGDTDGVDFALYCVGRDPKNRATAQLLFDPGHPEQYRADTEPNLIGLEDAYSSLSFNHIGLIIPHLYGKPASDVLRERLLQPIGFSAVEWHTPYWNAAAGGVNWYSSGSPKFVPRDYARIAYLLLRDGQWGDTRLVPASWIQRFRRSPDYTNMRSNVDGYFGTPFPEDLFRIAGSGMNWAFMAPSLDLVAIRTSRSYLSWAEQTPLFLGKLFEAVL